jgi:hypothetical protein
MAAVQKFFIKQNDTRPSLRCSLLDADELPVDLTAATIEFHMRVYPAGSTKISAGSVAVLDRVQGDVEYRWASGDVDTADVFEAEFEVTFSDGTIQTFPNDGHATVTITDDIA